MSKHLPQLMAILNVTPDSFSDGGRYRTVKQAVCQAKHFISEGANLIDIGGESSRPGAQPVSVVEELRRVIPIIEQIRNFSDIPLSIDTYKPVVAAVALRYGVNMVNDITGLRDPLMRQVVAQAHCQVVIMHMQGRPGTMLRQPRYNNVVLDIKKFFQQQVRLAQQAGIKKNDIILDPGIGFGKTVKHNLEILKNLQQFSSLRLPLLIGASRKSFIGKLTGADVQDRLAGTLAAHWLAVHNDASIVRVHDVAAHKQFFTILSS
ncbi:MAG: dihydropteroate synthase [Candidatus Kerfeldbacteria bacterium]|nr:dihydropteroate synthase [Candidatus Kerfeldbacteria bacterium]